MKPTRYPGAQPFSDDEISRAVFFGRKRESTVLTDQIVAHPLVVVYAKSGLGKTSLLQAGVSQPLRDAFFFPLIVRVNDVKRGPLYSVLQRIQDAANLEKVEYVHGEQESLWHFFKTAEFWDGDHLLTPVLVLDQFEELFTLHSAEARANFLRDLGHLVRGVRPASGSTQPLQGSLSDAPPVLRVVISLREDYLGWLEEASESIPQILDNRFRLSRLTVDAAREAVENPANVQYHRFATRPFRYEATTVRSILEGLTDRSGNSAHTRESYIEPFHLQLVCQRVEELVSDRQRSEEDVEIALDDLGGVEGLGTILRDFYQRVLDGIPQSRTRRQIRRLCEQYLISPEGRRLSLERNEIKRILKLSPDTLRDLVDRRLLRSDRRADSWYYELSHDSLVGPILANRKIQGIAFGTLGFLGSLFVGLTALFSLGGTAALGVMIGSQTLEPQATLGVGITIVLLLSLSAVSAWMCVVGVRRSVETLNRYIRPVE